MKNFISKHIKRDVGIIFLIGLGLFGAITFFDYRYGSAKKDIEAREDFLEEKVATLDEKIGNLSEVLLSTLTEEQKKNEDLRDALDDITDTVETLEKLSTTDKELLKKYSKVYFLNENFVPLSLSPIPEELRSGTSTNFQLHSEALPFLEDLMEDAEEDGLNLKVQSAYRSFATQMALKAGNTVVYGAGANKFSADQGYSEHQLGTTIDFTTEKLGGALTGFEQTPEYTWLLENAHRYGFVLSYPKGNAYYIFEPWHWRFVGEDLADRLHDDKVNFYDLDQRIIDGYLAEIFD